MSEQKPEPITTVALRTPELDLYARLGKWLAASEVAEPDADQIGATAALRMYFAQALGLPPLAAAELSIIKGKLVVSAKLMRALASRGGYRVLKVAETPDSCTAQLVDRDTGEAIGEPYTFTMEMAQRAKLVRERSPWQTHPGRMLWARASKAVIEDYAPEVAMGLTLDDEVDEITGEVWEEPEPQPEPYRTEIIELDTDPPTTTFVPPKGKRGGGGEE